MSLPSNDTRVSRPWYDTTYVDIIHHDDTIQCIWIKDSSNASITDLDVKSIEISYVISACSEPITLTNCTTSKLTLSIGTQINFSDTTIKHSCIYGSEETLPNIIQFPDFERLTCVLHSFEDGYDAHETNGIDNNIYCYPCCDRYFLQTMIEALTSKCISFNCTFIPLN